MEISGQREGEIAQQRQRLLDSLAPVGPLRRDRVELPGTERALEVCRPADFDRLLDLAANDPEQNLPYWAEIWPSGIALAAAIHARPGCLAGLPVLELGCGLGITAVVALESGADLLVTDYAQEALAFCALNALCAVARMPRSRQVNWRDPAADLLADQLGGYPCVLAADVLYEMRDLEPLLELVDRLVAPGGELWLAQPGRVPATLFAETLSVRGWRDERQLFHGPWPDPEDNRKGVVVTVHRLRKATT